MSRDLQYGAGCEEFLYGFSKHTCETHGVGADTIDLDWFNPVEFFNPEEREGSSKRASKAFDCIYSEEGDSILLEDSYNGLYD